MTLLDRAEVVVGGNDTELQNTLARASRSMDEAGKRMQRAGRMLSTRVTAPLAAAGGAALKFASDFDESMTRIETLVGINRETVQAWRQDLLELGPELGRTPRELADALFVVTSAGARGAEAMDILERAGKAASAGLGETRDIARAVTSAMQAFQDQGLSAAQATDTLVATVREGNLEAQDLAGSLGRVLGPAAAVGASFEEVGAFIAAFTRVGVSSEEAVTSLTSALNLAIRPTDQTREAMARAGFSVDQFRRAIEEDGIQGALARMMEATEGNLDVIGEFIPNVRALRGILATAGAQGEQYAQIAENIANSQGILNEAFERTGDTPAQTLREFKAEAAAMAITWGNELVPAFRAGMEVLSRIVSGFAALPKPIKQGALAIGALAAAVSPVLLTVGTLTRAVSGLTTAFVALTGVKVVSNVTSWISAFATLATQVRSLSGALALLQAAMGPAGWIALGATAIAGIAIHHAFRDWGEAAADAKRDLASLQGALEGLNEQAEDMTRQELARTISSLRLRAETVRRQIEGIRSELEQTRDVPASRGGLLGIGGGAERSRELEARMEALQSQGRELNQSIGRLTEQGRLLSDQNEETADSTGEVTSAVTRSADAVGELISGLQDELDQLRFSERELLKRELALEGATTAEREQALALFDKVEALRGAREAMRQFRETTSGATQAAAAFANTLVGLPAMLQHVSDRARNAFDQTSEPAKQMAQALERVEEVRKRAQLEKMRESMRLLNDMADRMARGFVNAFGQIASGSESVVEAIGKMVTNIIAELARLQAQKLFSQFFSGLLGGLGPSQSFEAPGIQWTAPHHLEGFAHGGQFMVGGSGGVDSQLVQFAATPGEVVTVDPSRGRGGGGSASRPTPQVNISVSAVDSKSFNRQYVESGAFGQTVRAAVEQAVQAPTRSDNVRSTMVTGR